MKKALLLTALLWTNNTFAQCPEDGPLAFSSQVELDAFGQEYPNCTEINGSVSIVESDVSDLSPLSNIKKINGALRIITNENLTSLNGLENLTETSILTITSVENIKDLEPLNKLRKTVGLTITNCQNLESFNGLENVVVSPSIMRIENNPRLKSIDAIQNIQRVDAFWIINNDSLETLPNFYMAGGTNGWHTSTNLITDNDNLKSLKGLDSMKSFARMDIINNPRLKSLDGLQGIEKYKFGIVFLDIAENDSLESIEGLEGLDSIFAGQPSTHGNIYIRDNPVLKNIEGLSSLQYMEGDLIIEGNPKITNIEGLSNLNTVIRKVIIQNNASLASLSGLDNLDHSSFDLLSISNCESLSFCSVKSVCSAIENNANVTIELNDEGCNNEAEVTEICLTSDEDITFEDLNIYPNPVTNHLYINNENNYPIQAINVYNTLGEKINLPHSDNQIDFTYSPMGIYFVEVLYSNKKQSHKIFKK